MIPSYAMSSMGTIAWGHRFLRKVGGFLWNNLIVTTLGDSFENAYKLLNDYLKKITSVQSIHVQLSVYADDFCEQL